MLSDFLNPTVLRRLACVRSFERGEGYFADDRVRALKEDDGRLTATVNGTQRYRVALWMEDGALDYSCTCPVGQDGELCKHCVAVGFAWMAKGKHGKNRPGGRRRGQSSITSHDVRAYLARQDKDTLVQWLMECADADERLHNRLSIQAAGGVRKGVRLATYKEAIDRVVQPGSFVDYYDMHDYAQGIDDAIDSLEQLLKKGYAAETVDLSEYALARVENVTGGVDDSDGHMGGLLERLQTLHLTACRKAKPDPESLARRLFEWELRGEWDSFSRAAETYAKVLGARGLAVYRRLAEAEWARIKPLAPGERDQSHYGKRFRVTQIMETLVGQTGDIEALVAIKSRDLSQGYDFLEIAEIYRRAGRRDRALEWAERGLKAFPHEPDSRLQDFVAAEYHRRKRHNEAMELIWVQFAARPDLERYVKLKQNADRTNGWSIWRGKALKRLRETGRIGAEGAERKRGLWRPGLDRSTLVEIFLWEKDVEVAWREATGGGCRRELWLKLAVLREKDHPRDAIAVYQKEIEPVVNQKNNRAYQEATALLRRIRDLMKRLGEDAEFARYLTAIRVAHKQKRNFIALLGKIK